MIISDISTPPFSYQGVPKSGDAFIKFIAEVQQTKQKFGVEGPITVHCSVGVGR